MLSIHHEAKMIKINGKIEDGNLPNQSGILLTTTDRQGVRLNVVMNIDESIDYYLLLLLLLITT